MYTEPSTLGDWPKAAPNTHQFAKSCKIEGELKKEVDLPAQHTQRLWRGSSNGWGCMQLIQMHNDSWLQCCHGWLPECQLQTLRQPLNLKPQSSVQGEEVWASHQSLTFLWSYRAFLFSSEWSSELLGVMVQLTERARSDIPSLCLT